MSTVFKSATVSVPMAVRVSQPVLRLGALTVKELKQYILSTMRHDVMGKMPNFVANLQSGELEQLLLAPLIDLAANNKDSTSYQTRVKSLAESIKTFFTIARMYPSKMLNNAITGFGIRETQLEQAKTSTTSDDAKRPDVGLTDTKSMLDIFEKVYKELSTAGALSADAQVWLRKFLLTACRISVSKVNLSNAFATGTFNSDIKGRLNVLLCMGVNHDATAVNGYDLQLMKQMFINTYLDAYAGYSDPYYTVAKADNRLMLSMLNRAADYCTLLYSVAHANNMLELSVAISNMDMMIALATRTFPLPDVTQKLYDETLRNFKSAIAPLYSTPTTWASEAISAVKNSMGVDHLYIYESEEDIKKLDDGGLVSTLIKQTITAHQKGSRYNPNISHLDIMQGPDLISNWTVDPAYRTKLIGLVSKELVKLGAKSDELAEELKGLKVPSSAFKISNLRPPLIPNVMEPRFISSFDQSDYMIGLQMTTVDHTSSTKKFNYTKAITQPMDYISEYMQTVSKGNEHYPTFLPLKYDAIKRGLPTELVQLAVPTAHLPGETVDLYRPDTVSMTSRAGEIAREFDYVGLIYQSLRVAGELEFNFMIGQLSGMFMCVVEVTPGANVSNLIDGMFSGVRNAKGDKISFVYERIAGPSVASSPETGGPSKAKKDKIETGLQLTSDSAKHYYVILPTQSRTSTYGFPTDIVLREIAAKVKPDFVNKYLMKSYVGEVEFCLLPLAYVPAPTVSVPYEVVYSEIDDYSAIPFCYSSSCLNPLVLPAAPAVKELATRSFKEREKYKIEYAVCEFTDIWGITPQFACFRKPLVPKSFFVHSVLTDVNKLATYIPAIYTYLQPEMFNTSVEAWKQTSTKVVPTIELKSTDSTGGGAGNAPSVANSVAAAPEVKLPDPPPPAASESGDSSLGQQSAAFQVKEGATISATRLEQSEAGVLEKEMARSSDSLDPEKEVKV